MRRLVFTLAVAALLAALSASPASAEFGLHDVDVTFTDENGAMETQAGAHPFAMNLQFGVNSTPTGKGGLLLDEQVKDLLSTLPPGLAGDPTVVPRCTTADFLTGVVTAGSGGIQLPDCPDSTAVGLVRAALASPLSVGTFHSAVYNITPSPGVAATLGFWVGGVPVSIQAGVGEEHPNELFGAARRLSQVLEVSHAELVLWGVPGDPAHDALRGHCLGHVSGDSVGDCETNIGEEPFLTLPRACEGPLTMNWEAVSWQNPTNPPVTGSVQTHDASGNPRGFSGCSKLDYTPTIASAPTSELGETGAGLDFSVDFADEGLANPTGIAASDTKKAVVTLPEGMTINPSVGEGLAVCAPADLKRETVKSLPGQGCPSASKLGTLRVETPIVDEAIDGEIFLAQQDDPTTTKAGSENPFDSLIALYFVFRNANLGVILREPVKVEPDPRTGQLVVTLDDVPQYPISHFEAHLRTGARAALVTPAACGTYTTKAELTPWANPTQPTTTTASFEITKGVGGGPCPPGGVAPFHPEFQAGAINNNAGSFSPFNMRLIRSDGEQNMTKFSSILPPGQIGSLAGVDKCSDAAVAVAKSKTGRRELASPSCPANSQIGRTLAGAGVGGALTYVGGQIYLAGPYKGAPLSVIAITPAVAGPFDAGTVAVRLGLDLNPKTAEVEVDGAASDPIPHILKGIVLKLRDLRVYVDRPNFTLNPTSCDESSTKATLFGSYLDVFSPDDDVSVGLSTRYQAANCLNLGFKPKLNLNLKGGTKRGGHPGLKALYKPRKGDANLEGLIVRLPRSAFLDQAHIRTICTRVQFAADTCPKAAQYGYIRAWTPLLDEPLQGPVWLRSSNHKLPDLVFDLHGLVDVEVATRIDSVKGGIRARVESAPDAPLTKVELRMQGGKKGLIINSRNLCGAISRANVQFSGHNGKQSRARPVMRADGCKKKRKAKHSRVR